MDIASINQQPNLNTMGIPKKKQDIEFQGDIEFAVKNKDDSALKEACEQMEGYFVKVLFDEMRKTVEEGDGLFKKSYGQKIFEDGLYSQYSKIVTQSGGIGIGDMLYKQLKKSQ